ncbi:ribulose-phosphate 3-epimerase [Candidatus Woesearchaeota archaeon]|nr:ribulose-phosphate 3-epimerase [Candidatus Woesearchaeota archaeon]
MKIAPSILSADKNNLNKEIKEIEDYADLIHVDIMDGRFVPPITFKADEIKKIKTKLPLDVHLMVENPLKDGFIDDYSGAGASIITIHSECNEDINLLIKEIKSRNIKTGISINPNTPLDEIKPYLDKIDMVLIMSVNPGYAGQKFIEDVLPKIRELKKLKPELDIEIDGGISKGTIKKAFDAGADIFVAGSSIFGKENRKEAIAELRNAVK